MEYENDKFDGARRNDEGDQESSRGEQLRLRATRKISPIVRAWRSEYRLACTVGNGGMQITEIEFEWRTIQADFGHIDWL